MLKSPENFNPNRIQVAPKSKRQMDYEAEQLESYRVLKSNRIVNENITEAIQNAQRAAKECR